jgi:hypothetical protein
VGNVVRRLIELTDYICAICGKPGDTIHGTPGGGGGYAFISGTVHASCAEFYDTPRGKIEEIETEIKKKDVKIEKIKEVIGCYCDGGCYDYKNREQCKDCDQYINEKCDCLYRPIREVIESG